MGDDLITASTTLAVIAVIQGLALRFNRAPGCYICGHDG